MVFEEAYVKDESRTNEEQEGRDPIWTPSSLPALLWLTTSAFKQTQNGLFGARAGPAWLTAANARAAHPRQGERADHAEGGLQPAGARSSEHTAWSPKHNGG